MNRLQLTMAALQQQKRRKERQAAHDPEDGISQIPPPWIAPFYPGIAEETDQALALAHP